MHVALLHTGLAAPRYVDLSSLTMDETHVPCTGREIRNRWRVCVCVQVHTLLLSCPMDCSPTGPSAHGMFQARILEWGNKRSHFNKKPSQYKEEQPLLVTTRQKALTAMKTHYSQKLKNYIYI